MISLVFTTLKITPIYSFSTFMTIGGDWGGVKMIFGEFRKLAIGWLGHFDRLKIRFGRLNLLVWQTDTSLLKWP